MYVRTYCTYYWSYWCTYVPTVRTALTNTINLFGFSIPRGAPALPSATEPPAAARGATPPAYRGSPCPGERRGAATELSERGAAKGALPGTGCLIPGKVGNLRDGKGFQHFWRRFPPGGVLLYFKYGYTKNILLMVCLHTKTHASQYSF